MQWFISIVFVSSTDEPISIAISKITFVLSFLETRLSNNFCFDELVGVDISINCLIILFRGASTALSLELSLLFFNLTILVSFDKIVDG